MEARCEFLCDHDDDPVSSVWETDVQPVKASAAAGHSGKVTSDPLAQYADRLRACRKNHRVDRGLPDVQILT